MLYPAFRRSPVGALFVFCCPASGGSIGILTTCGSCAVGSTLKQTICQYQEFPRVSPSCLQCRTAFEQSKRGNSLVQREFIFYNLGMSSMFGDAVQVDSFFIPKWARTPGMEVADLIAHTAGDNQRHA